MEPKAVQKPAGKILGSARGNRGWLTLIFFLALILRLAAVFFLRNFSSITGYENEEIALNLLAGKGYSFSHFGPLEPSAFIYPFYTLFLAAFFKLFGHTWLPVEVAQAVIGALGVPLIFFLGLQLFDRRVGLWASLIYSLDPVYIYWCTQGQALVIEVVLLMALTISWHQSMPKATLTSSLLPGLLLGLSALSRTFYLGFFPCFVLWMRWSGGVSWSRVIKFSALVLILALLVISPWTLRNYLRFHRLVLVTDNLGFNLWLGNNPHATGGLYTPEGRPIDTTIPPELMKEVKAAKDSPSRDQIFLRAAINYIKQNPARFFALIPGRLRALWYFEPDMPSRFRLFRNLSYLLLLPPTLVGMYLSRRWLKRLSLFYLQFATITIIYSIFFGQARFRFALEWSMILFAAFALAKGYDFLLKRGGSQSEALASSEKAE